MSLENLFTLAQCERTEHLSYGSDNWLTVAGQVADYLQTLPLEACLGLLVISDSIGIGFWISYFDISRNMVDPRRIPRDHAPTRAVQVIMFYRLYAISGRVKALGIWLIFHFGVFNVGSFVVVVALLKNTSVQHLASKTKTCDPVILLLTLVVMIKKHRRTKSTLASVFYRDGFVYFLGLAVTFVVNIATAGTAPYNCDGMFLVLHRIIHGILASRAILHLREQSQKELLLTERGRELTEIYFVDDEQDADSSAVSMAYWNTSSGGKASAQHALIYGIVREANGPLRRDSEELELYWFVVLRSDSSNTAVFRLDNVMTCGVEWDLTNCESIGSFLVLWATVGSLFTDELRLPA
ncbi:hypothetical protein FA15DRAFT_655993 [Coprinopsis marcescibilis]|uniref:Uncharacterized protein n=1 Tax=Coprinopsis marcescibilis TaxID=230819 RepID=A0A5C3KWZ1_COPMA|nr:hypothetical protein FA15DRAFT_655993 [Coprinopsis marcescibilis]